MDTNSNEIKDTDEPMNGDSQDEEEWESYENSDDSNEHSSPNEHDSSSESSSNEYHSSSEDSDTDESRIRIASTRPMSHLFNNSYLCYSVSMYPGNDRQDLEKGGKIIMPPSALDRLTRLNIEFPMKFKLTNEKKGRITHAGVLEFIADEGKVYIPYWMMHNLVLEEGDRIKIESVSLPVATFSKFQPQSSDFLDITSPRAVLENTLRNFACLTTGDIIAIKYNSKTYELRVLETRPSNAVSIIECDMNVEFVAPFGYQEPQREPRIEKSKDDEPIYNIDTQSFIPFSGQGIRLDGKSKKCETLDTSHIKQNRIRGIPDYDYPPFGLLRFDRNVEKPEPKTEMGNIDGFQVFQGSGLSLR